MTPAKPHMSARQWLMLCLLATVWGASFFSIGIAVSAVPPLTIVAVRVGLAALGLWAALRILGVPVPGFRGERARAIWMAFAVMGFFNNVIPQGLIVWGQTHISSSLASILNATMPLFTVFLAHFFTNDEKLTPRRLLGVLIGFSGVVAIIGPASLKGLADDLAGQMACLVAAFSYAVAVVIGRSYVKLGLKPMQMAFGQVTMAALLMVPVALYVDQPYLMPAPPLKVWVALVSLALVSTAFAYLLYFRLIAEAGATNASLVTLMIPAVAASLGIGFLGDHLSAGHLVGMALIALGLMVLDGRLITRLHARYAA